MISVTKIFRFESAHILSNHKGDCKNIHGHSYELHVSVSSNGNNKDSEMILDFKTLKTIVQENVISVLDHALILKESSVQVDTFGDLPYKIVFVPEEPTVEFIICWISEKLNGTFGSGLQLEKLKLFETADSYATWRRN